MLNSYLKKINIIEIFKNNLSFCTIFIIVLFFINSLLLNRNIYDPHHANLVFAEASNFLHGKYLYKDIFVKYQNFEDFKVKIKDMYESLDKQQNGDFKLVKKAKEFYKTIEPENEEKIPVKIYNGEWYTKYYIKKRSNIYLPSGTFENISRDLKLFYDSESDYTKLDIPWSRTYMLHGVPGTGKTSLI